jgi:hypothetical protein
LGGRHRGDRGSPCGTGELTLVAIFAVFRIIPIFAVFRIIPIFAVFRIIPIFAVFRIGPIFAVFRFGPIPAGCPSNCSDWSLSIL